MRAGIHRFFGITKLLDRTMDASVFISYASEDHAIAAQLADMLQQRGIKCFLDKKSVGWGNSIMGVIGRGLQAASSLIAVLSPTSVRSQWVPFEIGQAIALGTPVLPFLTAGSVELPGFLHDIHSVRSIEEFEKNIALALEAGQPLGTSGQLGPFSGYYLGLTWAPDSQRILVEHVNCRQMGDRIRGMIATVGVLEQSEKDDSYSCVARPYSRYTVSGYVRERLLVLSYHSIRLEELSSGALALQGNTTGDLFLGQWAGLVGSSVETSRCEWMRLDSSDRNDDDLLAEAGKLIQREGIQHYTNAKVVLLGEAGVGKTSLLSALHFRDKRQRTETNK
jgi:hypothetical protein